MPTQCQPFFFKYRDGPTLARHDLWATSISIDSLEIFDFPILGVIGYEMYSLRLSGMAFRKHLQKQIGTVCQMISVHDCSKEVNICVLPRFNLVIYE